MAAPSTSAVTVSDNKMSGPTADHGDFVYESGEDTDSWDLQPEAFWRGDDESELEESDSEEDDDDVSLDVLTQEPARHARDDSEYVMGDVEEYVYDPLEHSEARTAIRVIHLRPSSKFDSPLVCSLSTTSIGNDGGELPCTYEALSYAWGSTEKPELLFIIGTPKPRRATSFMLAITQNLHDALKHLRQKDRELVVWADAVCINQSNTEEKDRQVEVMSKIYRYAMVTHAWLGLDSAERDGEICLGWIEAIAENTKVRNIDRLEGPSGWDVCVRDIISDWGDPQVLALLKMFFEREFFKRRWTIQERYYAGLGVGLDVHCGKSTALWRPYEHGKALRRLEKWITEQYYDERIQKTPFKVTSAIPLAENPFAEGYDTVLSFMERHSDAQCSDPRDKVLSLLDVITDEYHFTLLPAKVRYGASISTVYIAFARALYYNSALSPITDGSRCKRDDALDSKLNIPHIVMEILNTAGAMRSLWYAWNSSIPSWAIDWRHSPCYDTKFALQTYADEVYREYMEPFIFGQDGLHGLCCNATLFDEIQQILPSSLSMISVERQILSMASDCVRTGLLAEAYRRPHATEGLEIGQHQTDSQFMSWRWCFRMASVPDVSDMARYSLDSPMVTVMNAVANAFVLSSHQNYVESTNNILPGPRLDTELYNHKKKEAMRGRTSYITKRGYIGVGPKDSREGDQIWILAGSRSPFVFRPMVAPVLASNPGLSEEEPWQQLGFKGRPHTANLIGSAHLFPPSPSDIANITSSLELQELCIL